MAYDRVARKLQNSKESSVAVSDTKRPSRYAPSKNGMKEGEQAFVQEPNKPLALFKKERGRVYKTYLSSNGNQIVDKNLSVKGITNLSNKLIIDNYPAFRVYIDDQQTWGTGAYSKVQFESKDRANVVDEYDNGSNIDYTNDYFIVPYAGIYHFNCSILFEDAQSEEVDIGETVSQILYIDSNGNGSYSDSDDELIITGNEVQHVNLTADTYWSARLAAECKLSASDKVQWAVYNNCGATVEPYNQATNDTKYNMFTGHLVCAI